MAKWIGPTYGQTDPKNYMITLTVQHYGLVLVRP